MKKYRTMIPVLLVILLLLSWYLLISSSRAKNNQYDAFLASARDFAGKKVARYAVDNYRKALEISDTPAIRREVSDFYKEIGENRARIAWCEQFVTDYPRTPEAYDSILGAYLDDHNFERVFDILEMAKKRQVDSEFIRETWKNNAYLSRLDYDSYTEVGVFSQNLCSVINDKALWGYIDPFGKKALSFQFKQAGAFTLSGFAPIVSEDGEAYFVDRDEYKVTVADERFLRLGAMVNDVFPAEAKDGSCYLVNKDFEIVSDSYEKMSAANSGQAAAFKDGRWIRLDTSGQPVGGGSYAEIVLDEKGFFNRHELFFAKSGDACALYNLKGETVGEERFEDAVLFNEEGYAAVKKDGKWGFVNHEGVMMIPPAYDGARSFSNGLAAVKIGEKWGFIDDKGELVMDAQYEDAKDFNSKGSCFVKIDAKWRLLMLYRLNRK